MTILYTSPCSSIFEHFTRPQSNGDHIPRDGKFIKITVARVCPDLLLCVNPEAPECRNVAVLLLLSELPSNSLAAFSSFPFFVASCSAAPSPGYGSPSAKIYIYLNNYVLLDISPLHPSLHILYCFQISSSDQLNSFPISFRMGNLTLSLQ
jgi:hypothetical protein